MDNRSSQHSTVSDRIKAQARREVWAYALFRPESAIVIALAIIGAGVSTLRLPWFPGAWWMWLGGGLLAEAAIVVSTLRDHRFYEHVLGKTFSSQFDLTTLRSDELKDKLLKALEYRELIVQEIGRREDVFDDKLTATARGMEDWIAQIHRLALNLDTYWRDPIIARDLKTVPGELTALKTRRGGVLGAEVQEELENAINMKQAQLDALQDLKEKMSRAGLQLDRTLAAMGAVYMQAKLLGSKDVDGGRAHRLQAEMLDQVRALEDTTLAMDELYRTNLAAPQKSGGRTGA